MPQDQKLSQINANELKKRLISISTRYIREHKSDLLKSTDYTIATNILYNTCDIQEPHELLTLLIAITQIKKSFFVDELARKLIPATINKEKKSITVDFSIFSQTESSLFSLTPNEKDRVFQRHTSSKEKAIIASNIYIGKIAQEHYQSMTLDQQEKIKVLITDLKQKNTYKPKFDCQKLFTAIRNGAQTYLDDRFTKKQDGSHVPKKFWTKTGKTGALRATHLTQLSMETFQNHPEKLWAIACSIFSHSAHHLRQYIAQEIMEQKIFIASEINQQLKNTKTTEKIMHQLARAVESNTLKTSREALDSSDEKKWAALLSGC